MSQDVFIVRMNWTDTAVLERLFLTRAAVVADIVLCEIPANEITAILQCNPEEHICDDVTETIARAVANEGERLGEFSPEARDFIEEFAGLAWARGLRVVEKAFAA